jgi:hypothetical protein
VKAFKVFMAGGGTIEGEAPEASAETLLNVSRYQNPVTIAISGGSLRIVDPDSIMAITVQDVMETRTVGYMTGHKS